MYNKKRRFYTHEDILVDILDKIDKEAMADVLVDFCPNPAEFLRRIFRKYGELTPENCHDVAWVMGDERKTVSIFYGMATDYDEKIKMHIYLILLVMCYVDEAGGLHHSNRAVKMNKELHMFIEDPENRKYIISIIKNVTKTSLPRGFREHKSDRLKEFLLALYSYEDTREYLCKEMKECWIFREFVGIEEDKVEKVEKSVSTTHPMTFLEMLEAECEEENNEDVEED